MKPFVHADVPFLSQSLNWAAENLKSLPGLSDMPRPHMRWFTIELLSGHYAAVTQLKVTDIERDWGRRCDAYRSHLQKLMTRLPTNILKFLDKVTPHRNTIIKNYVNDNIAMFVGPHQPLTPAGEHLREYDKRNFTILLGNGCSLNWRLAAGKPVEFIREYFSCSESRNQLLVWLYDEIDTADGCFVYRILTNRGIYSIPFIDFTFVNTYKQSEYSGA